MIINAKSKFGVILLMAALLAPAYLAAGEDDPRAQMVSLRDRLKSAGTPRERKDILGQIRRARPQRAAGQTAKAVVPEEAEARRRDREERIKKDPYQWKMYQLRQAMRAAKTREERETLGTRMQQLRAARAAETEAALTPEQRTKRLEQQKKRARLQAELRPLQESLHKAKTPEERSALRAQMRDIQKRYR
jgi:hypothetical protein